MNGSGKPGIRQDPTAAADFVGLVGNEVRLSIQSMSGTALLASVQYDQTPIQIEANSFHFTIRDGIRFLAIAIVRQIAEVVELRDEEGNRLTSFYEDTAQYRIRGT
ncbi:hypothetical protein DYQ86_04830 [Acidobacteria bacterium AB60]|nr:hypothetical protein DYQ86_04830 [Acidobacteria bacterium AB60]